MTWCDLTVFTMIGFNVTKKHCCVCDCLVNARMCNSFCDCSGCEGYIENWLTEEGPGRRILAGITSSSIFYIDKF